MGRSILEYLGAVSRRLRLSANELENHLRCEYEGKLLAKDKLIEEYDQVTQVAQNTIDFQQSLIKGLQNSVILMDQRAEHVEDQACRVLAGICLEYGDTVIPAAAWGMAKNRNVRIHTERLENGNILIQCLPDLKPVENPTLQLASELVVPTESE